jgi:hypothetical protein
MKAKPWVAVMVVGMLGLMGASTGWAQHPEAEEAPEVTGVEAQRSDGRYLGLAVEGNAFVLRFYDEDKKETTVDVSRGVARWSSPQRAGQQRAVLNSNGKALTSPPVVRPPLAFNAFIVLLSEDGEAIESFNFNLRTLGAE